ncbi:hydroxysteroid 11-beta-dehydrogenase 1-like protein isoform X3 [Leptonychotes weddellii]|uniref:Hydroxysteroid 11-beta-dehydrogenase 1-like protein n=1 Tax=Leptonychotes weddellii TaxID=9713 RepID=A0A7F8Q7I3_LEPWE|nr:hydroxysteroid 11-beta-dehydrogenase 1-like protein isoform X3 [Leptonychotes weddellii]
MKVLLLTGLGALFFSYYWDDNFDPGGLDYLVLNHLGATPAGTRSRSVQATRWLLQVNFLSYVQLTSLALPILTDSKGSLVVVSSLLGHVPTSFSSPYSAAKFALDGFFGSLRRELDVQDVNVAITMCVLGLRDRASTAEGVRSSTSPLPRLPEPPAVALLHLPGGEPSIQPPQSGGDTNRDTSELVAVAQDRVIKTERDNRESLPAPGNGHNSGRGDTVAASILQMRKLRLREVV